MNRGGAVIFGATIALTAVVSLGAVGDVVRFRGGEVDPHEIARRAAAALVPPDAGGLLGGVAGTPAVACDLAVRTLGNRWGSGDVRPQVTEPLATAPEERAQAEWAWSERPSMDDATVLLEGLAAADPCVRRVAAALLFGVKDPEVRSRVRERAERAEGTERLAAMAALAGAEDAESGTALRRMLSDPLPEVRRAAAWGLGEMEDVASIGALGAALGDADPSVRENAAWALGRIERSGAVDVLTRAVHDPDASVRRNVAWALGRIEDSAAIPTLVALLSSDAEVQVRSMAAWALGRIED